MFWKNKSVRDNYFGTKYQISIAVTDLNIHAFFFIEMKEKALDRRNGQKIYTGLFVSPSGISELDCATTKTDTAERSISIGRESLQVFFY